MKWLAVALLVANVLLLGWQLDRHIRERAMATAGERPLPANAPELQLVSELPSLPPRRETAQTKPPTSTVVTPAEPVVESVDLTTEINSQAESSNKCLRIGPVRGPEALDRVRNWLRERTTVVNTRTETVREQRYFWVYLEPASDEQAQRSLDDLKRRGVTDYMLIRRGGLRNAISLGLFRSQDSVNRRLAEMSQKGYKPVVVPQFESTDHYWLTATLRVEAADAVMPSDVKADAQVEPIACADQQNTTATP